MLCESCQQREATVHLTTSVQAEVLEQEPAVEQRQHFCQTCADLFFATSPGMSAMRGLICLSDSFRSKLYDLLEAAHPEAFYEGDDPAIIMRSAEALETFLRQQLKQEGLELNDEAFGMLYCDLIGSHHFYTRRDDYKKRKG
jgi:hypothetical protein